MEAVVQGIGILAPGLPDWAQAREVLAGDRPAVDEPLGPVKAAGLPRAEARRAPLTTHLGLVVAAQALGGGEPDEAMPSVWASADSDLAGLEKDMATLAEEPPWISPQRFQNSVHNTPSGYWSIVTGCRGPATALSSGDETFAAGLVEAIVTLQEGHRCCLLVACDEQSPPSLVEARPVRDSFAVALLLGQPSAEGTPLVAEWDAYGRGAPSICEQPLLERLRQGNPAARSLPLLSRLAQGRAASASLAWGGGSLTVSLTKRGHDCSGADHAQDF
jgi:hypothetical protein